MFSDERNSTAATASSRADPLGTGLGVREQVSRRQSVTMTYSADGASNQDGQVYESFTCGALEAPRDLHHRKQSVRYGTSVERSSAQSLLKRGRRSHPGRQIDGMDVEAVHARTRGHRLVPRRQGAIILEMKTIAIAALDGPTPRSTARARR